jgi:CRISPR-associated protein Csm1
LKEQAMQVANSINKNLLNQFQGDIFLGMGFVEITGNDFKEGNMGRRWQQVNENLQKQRLQPFKDQVSGDVEFFTQQKQHEAGACTICGRDDKDAGINHKKICQQCHNLEEIGRVLADSHFLLWVWGADRKTVSNKLKNSLYSLPMPGTDCSIYFLQTAPEFSELTDLSSSHLEAINTWTGLQANSQGYSQGIRHLGKWQKSKGDWEFDDFAEKAQGINRMGILRMDVDNLGEIFIRGLNFGRGKENNPSKSMGSLSRVATLSRQLHLFFAGYLQEIMDEFSQSQIIYAGGDDVFIIGSWHELPEVALKIRTEFQNYCAHNPSFTLSGGIAVVGGKYPISRAAELAGEAEAHAKQLTRGLRHKDALSFLVTTIGWESYETALELRNTLVNITDKMGSQAVIERLRQVVIAIREIKTRAQSGDINELIYWDKWRWRLVYNLKRMEKRYPEITPELNALLNQLISPQNLPNQQAVMEWLELPVRWAEFLMRSKKND